MTAEPINLHAIHENAAAGITIFQFSAERYFVQTANALVSVQVQKDRDGHDQTVVEITTAEPYRMKDMRHPSPEFTELHTVHPDTPEEEIW